ncbi:MAG: hypothetical protein HN704_13940 [Bacteroidetes bacterium]|jgi:CRISPR-associated protein Csm1|nr:hypothetical protein [Bacteroidota bacterium]MBT6686031.1 hypothetical protein [Bacteroidota bacterium]MBT7144540.1 hypothetical protein [Bacteroidota bacterium]MBT7492697.1 hypothetical protein [Bacteroidota bacterium]
MENKYLLKGDLSGIQDFIFNVSSKKAAKSLKSRSFYVQIVGDLALKFIESDITDLDDFSCEVLYNGGGNFYLNIYTNKNDEEVVQEVNKWQRDICEELIYDELYIALSLKKDKGDFGETWANINKESNISKNRKFESEFNLKLFQPYSFKNKENDKDNQRWYDATSYIYDGIVNKRWATVTESMVKKGYLKTKLFCELKNIKFEESFKTIANKLPLWDKAIRKNNSELIEKVVNIEKEKDSNYIEPKDGNIIDFTFISEFAKERTGTAKLGILKMDVDDLSKLFRDINNEKDGKEISGKLGDFFDKHIYEIWENDFQSFKPSDNIEETKIPYKYNIYPVFTGGDDCFFIGAWDAILSFTKTINSDFESFVRGRNNIVNNNQKIIHKDKKSDSKEQEVFPTLSAGIVIVDEHYPVVQFAELVEEAIGKAKKRKKKGETVKNAITIFDEVFTWEDYNEIIEVAEKFAVLIREEKASKSVLERIRQSSAGYEKLYIDAKKGSLKFPRVDRLRYYLRGAGNEAEGFYEKYIFTDYKDALINAFEGQIKMNPMKYPVAARIAEFKLRTN